MSRRLVGFIACSAALVALACTDGFFFPPASDQPSTVALEWALSQSGPGEAFDQADNVRVRLFQDGAATAFFEEIVAFTPGPGQSRVAVTVPLGDVGGLFGLDVDVRVGSSTLFRGAGEVALTAGETTTTSVTLEPVGFDLALPTPYPTFTAFGDAVFLGGATLFATGDTIPGANPEWSNLDPDVVTVSQGSDDRWVAVALADGTARLTATRGDLNRQATVTVLAEVVSVDVTPEEATVPEEGEAQLTAIARDRRENPIPDRTVDWRSLSPTIASVNGTGLVRGEVAGEAVIEAEVDGVVGTAEVVVVPALPTATTLPAVEVSSRAALVRGVVNPRGFATAVRFEFGTDPTLSQASSTAPELIGSGQQDVQVDALISDLAPATTYYVRVAASVAAGTARGEILSFVTSAAPNAPSDVTLIIDDGVYVRWTDNSDDETGFEIERAVQIPAVAGEIASQQDGDFERIGNVGSGEREFYDATPPAGRLTYRVRACGTGGCSDYSPPASIDYVARPVVSTAAAAQVTTQTAVLQGSVDPRGSPTMVWFEVDDNPGLTSPLSTLKVNVGAAAGVQSFSQFVDGLSQGVPYYFRIRASNSGGESSGSVLTFTTLTPPIAPSGVLLTYANTVGVDVRWSDNSDNETYFEIEREYAGPGAPGQDGSASAAIYVSVGTVAANTNFFHDEFPPSPAVLNYRVRACHASGCSSYSAPNTIYYGGGSGGSKGSQSPAEDVDPPRGP